MSILNFSKNMYFLDAIDGEYVEGGLITRTSSREIGHIRVMLYLKGTLTNQRMTLRLTDSLTSPAVTYDSSEVLLSDIDKGDDWLGWVRFDFDKEWMIDTESYHLLFKVENYTESPTLYIGAAIDYPVFDNAGTGNLDERAVKIQTFDFE